jgi:hypothetical protein
VTLGNLEACRPEIWNTPYFQAEQIPRISGLRRPAPPACTVFVSHCRADQKAIGPLWDFLQRLQDRHPRKLAVWSDGWGIPLEKRARWAAVQEIPAILCRAEILVFLLTSDFVSSPWCVLEVVMALTQRGLRELYSLPALSGSQAEELGPLAVYFAPGEARAAVLAGHV